MAECNIIDKLNYLLQTKDLIKTALEAGGSDVTDSDTFRSYAEKIIELRRVTSVNGMQGDVVLNANDVGAYSKEETDAIAKDIKDKEYKEMYLTREEYDNLEDKDLNYTKYHIYDNE